MGHWMITGRDAELGVYEGSTKDEAVAAMLTDAGDPGATPDPDLRVTELCSGCVDAGLTPEDMGAVEMWMGGLAFCRECADTTQMVSAPK